jgi:hypothetical protein
VKCPWCNREIGFVAPTKFNPAICPVCQHYVASVFHRRTVLLCASVLIPAAWFLAPLTDLTTSKIVWLVAVVAPLIAGMRLEKWR